MSIATAESHTTPHHRGVPKIVFLPRSGPWPGFSVFGRADTNNLLLPNLCAMEALTHIQETAPKLNPINLGKPHDNLSLTRRRKAQNKEERLEEGEILFDPTITCKNSLAECFRIFTDSPEVHLVLRQLHELIQADFAKNHLKALKCFVEVDLLKCDRLLSQL
jgi:hypothetical protein